MRILLIVALCVVGVSARDFSRHLTADHVHDHDYPFESRTAKREKNYEPPTPELEFPTGPLGHYADAQALRMNHLQNKLEVLTKSVDSLNTEKEDVSGALNFLRMLKGNGCKKDQFQCLRKPGQIPQCVNNYAVCDGVKDCRDGQDEESSTCVNRSPVGSSWGGDLQWIGCASHRSKRMYVIITRAERHPFVPSIMSITATLVFTWVENGRTMSNTEQTVGVYSYGARAMKLNAAPNGHVSADVECTFTDDVHCHGKLFKASTGTTCSEVILNRH